MLTFENVMNAPLDKLQTAVTDWGAMVGKLEELAREAREGMKAKADKAEWSGVTAGAGRPFIAKVAKEFEDAAAQAKGVHQLLGDAHTTFKEARDQLKQAAEVDAPKAGFRVDADGRVSRVPFPDPGTENAARHDPEYMQTAQRHRGEWQRKIDALIESCDDADQSLARALQANVTDEHNFTRPKYTTLDGEQADRAATLMDKLVKGGTARNPEALRELEELLDDNRQDPEFATAFYRQVGAEGTLHAYTVLSLDATSLGKAGQDRIDMVANIQSDMGAMLGLATQKNVPNHLDAAWTTELMKAGRKEIDASRRIAGPGATIYGYQALGALLREGTYDKDFLTSVGRDMVAMDRKNPKAWEHGAPIGLNAALNHNSEGGSGFYPLTGLMEALGNNPDAATAFFNEPVREDSNKDGIVTLADKAVDGQHGKDQGMVDYMLDKKAWVSGFDGKGGVFLPGQEALGGALMAAVSGRPAGDVDAQPVTHTGPMTDVMERVVDKIGDNPDLVAKAGEEGEPLSGLSGVFGQMAAEYAADMQAALGNEGGHIKGPEVMAEFDKYEMSKFLGAIAQDPEAYGAITNAHQTVTSVMVNDVIKQRDDHSQPDAAIRAVTHPGGEIAGILSQARADGLREDEKLRGEDYVKGVETTANWVNRGISMAGAKYVELFPIAGDLVGWLQEDIANSVVESAQKDMAKEAADVDEKAERDYLDAEEAVKKAAADAVERAAVGTEMSRHDINDLKGEASTAAADGHTAGRGMRR